MPSQLKIRREAGSLEERAFLAVIRAAETLQWPVAELLRQYRLSSTQYNALRILRGAGPEGLACREIADRMINRDPDITRLLTRLQKRGLVKRSRAKHDRRVILTNITSAGLDLVDTIHSPMDELHHTRFKHLGEPQLKKLIALLKSARETSE